MVSIRALATGVRRISYDLYPSSYCVRRRPRPESLCTSTRLNRQYSSRPIVGQADKLTDFNTRALFDVDHDIFRQSCRRFFEDLKPHHSRWEAQGHVDRDVWNKVGDAGMLCINIPEEAGGIGADFFSAVISWEEQMYSNGVGTSFPLHSDIVAPYIAELGTKEQKERIIPQMVTGEIVGSIAMTEPSAGSDLQGIKTLAKKDGDDWILNGSKVFITNGYLSDLAIIVAITNPVPGKIAHGTSLFLVENGMKGYTKGKPLQKVGQKAVDTCELFFDDIRLPKTALLGEVNKGFYYLMEQLPRERLLIAVLAQAHCEYMFEETRQYVKERKAFGKTLAHIQTIQHKLAEMKTEICIGRAFTDQCIQLYDEGKLDTATASMAKYWCSDLANKVSSDCLQLHGGNGYMWEYPIARAFADCRVQSIYGGSNEIMKEVIARGITS